MPLNKENKEQRKIDPIRIFFYESLIFLSVFILGIITTFRIKQFLKVQSIPQINFPEFIFYFFLVTIIVFFISFLKSKKGKSTFFKIFFFFAISFGSIITLSVFFGDLMSLFLIFLLIALFLKKPSILLHNFLLILATAGVGSILALRLKSEIIILLLIIFSIYDFIAVYKTKHMQKIAKAMIKAGSPLAFIIPSKIEDFKKETKRMEVGKEFLFLGGGDIVFPLILCCSLVPINIFYSLFLAIFSYFGLSFSFYIFFFQRKRKPIPALPPIALLVIVGFILGKFLF